METTKIIGRLREVRRDAGRVGLSLLIGGEDLIGLLEEAADAIDGLTTELDEANQRIEELETEEAE